MPIARHGLREILIATVACHGLGALAAWGAIRVSPLFWAGAGLLWLTWAFVLAFFRDPGRRVPSEPGVLVSPADGRVADVTHLDHHEDVGGPALRIGIFLSIFNVHVNRVPCDGRIVQTRRRPGEYLDARHPECGVRNESNTLVIEPDAPVPGPIVVRQIAGLIARRIVCNVGSGDRVRRGQRLGLIKFGSRTELIVPAAAGLEPAVRVNDDVRGGSTVLVRHVGTPDTASATSTQHDAARVLVGR